MRSRACWRRNGPDADRAARAAPQGRLARQLREVAAEAAEPGWAALPAAAARAAAFQAAAEALVYDALMLRVRARGSRPRASRGALQGAPRSPCGACSRRRGGRSVVPVCDAFVLWFLARL